MSSPLLTDAEPEPFEVLGAPPIVSIDSLSRALSPAVSSSLSRHPDARPGHIGMHLLSWLEGRPPPDAPPMAPRMASDGGRLHDEMRSLEGILANALNVVRVGSNSTVPLSRLILQLIEAEEHRRARTARYTTPDPIWSRIGSGEVILIRASWLLRRAGYRPIDHNGEVRDSLGAHAVGWVPQEAPKPLPRRQDLEANFPEAVMSLSELQALHRRFQDVAANAQRTRGAYAVPEVGSAKDDGVDALPVLSVSHCWETAVHPDPECRTLRILAAELADGGWEAYDEHDMPAGAPTCGLPLYRLWGFEEMGVFLDWCSLPQPPRTDAEGAAFRRAFASQDVWFAHTLVTSFIVTGQPDGRLSVPRERRGWPFYEEASARLLKKSPPATRYELPYHESAASALRDDDLPLVARCWPKVVHVERSDGGPIWSRRPLSRTRKSLSKAALAQLQDAANAIELAARADVEAAAAGIDVSRPLYPSHMVMGRRQPVPEPSRVDAAREKAARLREVAERQRRVAIGDEAEALARRLQRHPPPLSPSRFSSVLRSKAFADGSDASAIAGMYRAVLEDGLGGLRELDFTGCGWGDEHIEHLATTLNEVRASELLSLDLSDNDAWTDGEALAPALCGMRVGPFFARVPLRSLTHLALKRCTALLSLPESLGRLVSLEHLDLGGCEALRTLPPSLVDLAALQTLTLAQVLPPSPFTCHPLSTHTHTTRTTRPLLHPLLHPLLTLSSPRILNPHPFAVLLPLRPPCRPQPPPRAHLARP